MRRLIPDYDENHPDLNSYDDAAVAAEEVRRAMPGIGFASMSKRYNAFVAVCRHLDSMIEKGELTADGAQLAIVILRVASKPFVKAAVAFDIYGPRLRFATRADLPRTAQSYMADVPLR
ncbi:hypothetical protein HN018_13110 [Lichenicola cladoniae]|uniref:Uncharacterized protein n=1 Tax=Lichenicola cladoniae TaxID=1484109 RepID=A0A6M8HRC5_9PROT|nr:hypothetical protein [Lichenicola cladoniae]NPD68715.1 hypothetical protein [Acetobacteraceae bacterium]QKE90850.1 hypothetical protein HN018_13110 [Lichenicola cladoniae]